MSSILLFALCLECVLFLSLRKIGFGRGWVRSQNKLNFLFEEIATK